MFCLPLVFLFSVTMFSCKKELSVDRLGRGGDNNPGSIAGDWNFLNLHTDASSTATGSYLGVPVKVIYAYASNSVNNTGTVSFTANSFTVNKMGFDVSTKAHITTYTGPVKDEQDVPFSFSVPAYGYNGGYKQIGSDSLYFPDGSLFQELEINGQQITNADAGGATFAIRSDSLFIYQTISQTRDSTVTENDISIKLSVEEKATNIASFKRK